MKTKQKTNFTVMMIVILFSGMAYVANAAPMDVKADKVIGSVDVQVSEGAKWAPVKNGDQIAVGATVRTGAGASCMLKWATGNVVKISPLSMIKVEEAEKTSSGGEKSSLNIKQGKLFAHVKKLDTADSKFEVKTPTAVAGVRGSDVFGINNGNNSTFGVTNGLMAVNAGGNEVVLEPGFAVSVDVSGSMSDIIPIPLDIKQEANENAKETTSEAAKDENNKEGNNGGKEEPKGGGVNEENAVNSNTDNILNNVTTDQIIQDVEKSYKTGTVDLNIHVEPR